MEITGVIALCVLGGLAGIVIFVGLVRGRGASRSRDGGFIDPNIGVVVDPGSDHHHHHDHHHHQGDHHHHGAAGGHHVGMDGGGHHGGGFDGGGFHGGGHH